MKDTIVLNLSQNERFQQARLTPIELNQAAYFIQSLIKESYIYFSDFHDYLPRAQKWFDVVYKSAAAKEILFKEVD